MKHVTPALGLMSAIAGAGGVYFFDTRLGRRRRARAKDIVDHAVHEASRGMRGALRDLEQRAHGLIAHAHLSPSPHAAHAMDDAAIVARVRSRLGHVCAHPHAIAVTFRDGVLELTGPILKEDVQDALRVAWTTLGVHEVADRLVRHATPDGVPGLEGPPRRTRRQPGPAFWSPGTRLLVGTGGMFGDRVGDRERRNPG